MFWGQGGSLVMASGEGSRGGKVIDHTRSGKPIYDTTLSQNSTEHEGHKSFDKNDHADAAHAHSKAAKALRQPKKLSQNYWKKKAHENAARDHSQIANKNHPAYHKAPFGSKDWRG